MRGASSWGWQIWRGMWSDGGHRGAMSNRWGGRVSVPDPRFGLHAFREFVQHVQEAVIPASLFCRLRPDFRHSRPDSQVLTDVTGIS